TENGFMLLLPIACPEASETTLYIRRRYRLKLLPSPHDRLRAEYPLESRLSSTATLAEIM
ncbi:MAG: hypothetical protein VYB05_09575, partial [Pseudomonadota bacterium]|nr:hypothetical protein [Pseudomonadota bacterium]